MVDTSSVTGEKTRVRANRKKLADYSELEQQLRKKEQEIQKDHDKSENDIKSLQSVGQKVGEVLKQLSEDNIIVKRRTAITRLSWSAAAAPDKEHPKKPHPPRLVA